jgi:ribosomal protein L6P/L9E
MKAGTTAVVAVVETMEITGAKETITRNFNQEVVAAEAEAKEGITVVAIAAEKEEITAVAATRMAESLIIAITASVLTS